MPVPEIDWASLTQPELDQLRIDLDAAQNAAYRLASLPADLAALEATAQAAPVAVRDQVRDRLTQIRDRLNAKEKP